MAKTEFLQIRLSPEDRERLLAAAAANHLDASTWARQAILRAVELWEAESEAADDAKPRASRDATSRKGR